MPKTSTQRISSIMEILKKHYNTDKTTLNKMRTTSSKDPYKILISCLLSLRARDENTEIVSKKLFNIAETPEEILKLSDKKLKKIIFSSGHFNKKAEAIKHVSREILEKYNGKVPSTKEELLSIKHIGPKTANIVLAFAYDQQVLPIDTHCHRIPNRLGWIKTKTPEQTEEELIKILPKKYWPAFNSMFIQFGKGVCQPVSPWCSKCPVKKLCKRINIKKSR